jgi:hypothetical protein
MLLFNILLLIAAALRFVGLPHMPPGISHDEVAEVIIARRVLEGHHALFFEEAYGQEPLFIYLLAGALVVLGENVFALRFVTASVGLLTVAASARLARRLFNVRIALVTTAGMAVMLWPIFWSRVGLRGMTLPLMLCLGWDALWDALQKSPSRQRDWKAVWAGVFFGLTAYTYLAARGLPILFAAFVVYLWLFNRPADKVYPADKVHPADKIHPAAEGYPPLRHIWRPLLVTLMIASLFAVPLVVYLSQNPQLQFRVYEVDEPLRQLLQGRPKLVVRNIPRILAMFTVEGDFTVRNNAPHRPVFPEPGWAALFYLGGIITIMLCFRDARYALILIWLGVMLSPSMVTTDAPNFVRTLGALPVVMIVPAIGVEWMTIHLHKRAPGVLWLWGAILAIIVLINAALTVRDYQAWSEIEVTRFVWQSDLAAVAHRLDAWPQLMDGTVSGVANASMDDLSLALMMRRDEVRVRWVDTGSPLSAGGALVVPADGGWLFVPSFIPISALISRQLDPLTLRRERWRSFTAYQLSAYEGPGDRMVTAFTGHLNLLAVHAPAVGTTTQDMMMPGQMLELLTVWQTVEPPYPPLKAFIHVIDGDGNLCAQHDGLDSPSRFWQPGDVIIQAHAIALPENLQAGSYELRVGLYDPETLQPYPMIDGRPFFEAGRLTVHDVP